jgi:plasmid stabilization system protein ParE
MDEYRVIWTKPAKNDTDCIYDYISERLLAPVTAENIVDTIHDAAESLSFMPQIWPLVYDLDNNLIPPGYRKCLVKNYIIVYLVYEETELASPENKNTVGIIRIFHGRQNWLSILASPE